MSKKREIDIKRRNSIRQEERCNALKIFKLEIENFEQEIFNELSTRFQLPGGVKDIVINERRRKRFITKLSTIKLEKHEESVKVRNYE